MHEQQLIDTARNMILNPRKYMASDLVVARMNIIRAGKTVKEVNKLLGFDAQTLFGNRVFRVGYNELTDRSLAVMLRPDRLTKAKKTVG